MLGPIIASLGLSFFNWNLISSPKFTGLRNYQTLKGDYLFWKSLWNTFYFTLGWTSSILVPAFVFAVILNHKLRGITIFRAIIFLPVICPVVGMALVWG